VGAAAARLTPEDFVTPPEFEGLRLGRSAGQVGGVRLELVASGGGTRLGSCYQQVPVRVLPPFRFAGEPAALVYLLNPTAGLMDGDGHRLDVVARSGTRAVVTGQSATRIHPAVGGFATQQWRVSVETGAELVLLPGPAIPFRGCRHYQQVRIDLAAGARVIWGDAWLPGRYARGAQSEFFAFDRLVQDLEVRREGALVFRDRFRWEGPWDPETARWHLGTATATGSLFVTGPVKRGEAGLPDTAVLPLASQDTCLRWCGSPAEVLSELVSTALRSAAGWSGGPGASPWLLASHHLAPSHWFTSACGNG
jgi:urease accessory protein